jgi:hypothetical protein
VVNILIVLILIVIIKKFGISFYAMIACSIIALFFRNYIVAGTLVIGYIVSFSVIRKR